MAGLERVCALKRPRMQLAILGHLELRMAEVDTSLGDLLQRSKRMILLKAAPSSSRICRAKSGPRSIPSKLYSSRSRILTRPDDGVESGK